MCLGRAPRTAEVDVIVKIRHVITDDTTTITDALGAATGADNYDVTLPIRHH